MSYKYDSIEQLTRLGISYEHAVKLRRISMTLRRWHELECGTGEGQTTYSVERDGDEPDSKPFMRIQYPTSNGYVDKRWSIPDRETGARRRLDEIMSHYPDYKAYVQGDPRGAALYIIRPGDVPPGGDINAYYNRGIVVCQ